MKYWRTVPLLTILAISSMTRSEDRQIELVKSRAQNQVKALIEPLLERYCTEQCKVLSIEPTVAIKVPDQLEPGFEDLSPATSSQLAPSSVSVKLLVDEMLGPVSRRNLLDLIDQHLDALSYNVQIETKVAKFPQPPAATRKVAKLRERISREFKTTVNDLFSKFCPDRCLLADYEIKVDPVNLEEAQYGQTGEFFQDGDTAVRLSSVGATLLMDESLTPEERANILEMARLKTNHLKNVDLKAKSLKFPDPGLLGDGAARGLASGKTQSSSSEESNSSTTNKSVTEQKADTSTNTTTVNNKVETQGLRQERFERIEKIERVEDGDAVQKELEKFKVFGLVFACSIISLLIFVAMATMRSKGKGEGGISRIIQTLTSDPTASNASKPVSSDPLSNDERAALIAKRYEIERYIEELGKVFGDNPKVAKQVFSRILTEEGVETTAAYIDIFGEGVVVDMLRDPSLQADLTELMDYYAKNQFNLSDDEKLELLRSLYNRTVSAKLYVMGNRSTTLFDFIAEMNDLQVMDLIENESTTVKAVVLTQCDPQKRTSIYTKLDEGVRMALLTELSRIDHLPRDYVYHMANALKRKRSENPRLNTEALPGSDVLVTLLEKTGYEIQRRIMGDLDTTNPDSARSVKNKLVSINTLRYLRDNQLLEVILSLKHEELLLFLKGVPEDIRRTIFEKSPKDLVAEIEDELTQVGATTRETYSNIERKVINRIKVMANDGIINLIEVNERMFAPGSGAADYALGGNAAAAMSTASYRKAGGGW